ncbi:MAG: alpha/beta fold hydrolase [Candidatus Hydrogenedentota bacterium]|nr:MAG: alpha/beta fold hydrolase [Candidatus Hydrogenedentota bacterium]
MNTELVHFYSEGARLAGMLYLPDIPEPEGRRAGIVLCHGFTGIKENILPQYAEAFAEAGLVALPFDYRGFGESDGQRGRLLWHEQVTDIRNAITYLSTRPEVDAQRLGLWGTSYGGALAPYAFALDDRVKACAGQLGFSDGYGVVANRLPPEQIDSFRGMIEEDRRRRVLHNDPMYGDAMALAGDPEMTAFFEEAAKTLPQLKNREILIQFIDAHLEFSPITVIHKKGNRPLLLIAAELDVVCPMDNYKELYDKAPEPKKWVVFEKTRHFEFYEGEPAQRSAAEAVNFFKEYLGS